MERGGDAFTNLNDVVAEHVGHERVRGGQDLAKDHLLLLGRGALELLLNEPRAVLVHAELDEVSDDVAQLQMRLSIGAEVLEQAAARHRRRRRRRLVAHAAAVVSTTAIQHVIVRRRLLL